MKKDIVYYSKIDGSRHIGTEGYPMEDMTRYYTDLDNNDDVLRYDDVKLSSDIDFEKRRFEIYKSIVASLMSNGCTDYESIADRALYMSDISIKKYIGG